MYKKLNLYMIEGIIFTALLGTLLHFVYEWTGSNAIAGIFCPVNESVWEHLKLLYYPMSIWIVYGYFKYGRKNPNYVFASLSGIVTGLVSIPVIFYIYTAIAGRNYLAMDIITFIIGICVGFFTMFFILKNFNIRFLSLKWGIIIWEFLFVLFVLFTEFPPSIFLFES